MDIENLLSLKVNSSTSGYLEVARPHSIENKTSKIGFWGKFLEKRKFHNIFTERRHQQVHTKEEHSLSHRKMRRKLLYVPFLEILRNFGAI